MTENFGPPVARSICVYLTQLGPDHQILSHAFPDIIAVTHHDNGGLALTDINGLTVAYYAPGGWVGWHDIDSGGDL